MAGRHYTGRTGQLAARAVDTRQGSTVARFKMALRLRVVSAHSKGLGETASKVFGVSGGTVGRAEDNDWVLPDPDRFISGHHVRIEYRHGEYWLADTSSNGTYINDSHTPQSESGSYALHDGD